MGRGYSRWAPRAARSAASGSGDETAIAKLWHSELASRVADECLQLFGGYGFMADMPIARAFVDARVQEIYGGTSEVMKLIIARRLGLAQ